MPIQLGGGKTADITSIENIDLDQQVIYFEGERLTEATARAIAARHGRKGGRPRLAAETSRLGIRQRELHDRLKSAAEAAGVSESEIAREAIDQYLTEGV